jgi:hypothetical protein
MGLSLFDFPSNSRFSMFDARKPGKTRSDHPLLSQNAGVFNDDILLNPRPKPEAGTFPYYRKTVRFVPFAMEVSPSKRTKRTKRTRRGRRRRKLPYPGRR